jgi:hypothetical protein
MPRHRIEAIAAAIILSALAAWMYAPTLGAGFTSDFTAHVRFFEERSQIGWWNSFGWRSNLPVLFGLMYAFYKVFHLQALPWFLLFTMLHALNALGVFLLTRRLLPDTRQGSLLPAALAALWFLLGPYQAEAVVWKVCLHYLLVTGSLLAMMLLLTGRPGPWPAGRWALFHLLFAVALFSLEIALIFPFILALTAWWWGREQVSPAGEIRRRIGSILLPQLVLLTTGFVWNRLRLGTWVGHYGADTHLALDPAELVSHILNYFLKYLLLTREWPHAAKAWLGDWHQHAPASLWAAASVSLTLLAFLLWRSRRMERPAKLALGALVLFFLALAPVITLYFAYTGHSENDRYGYVAAALLALALSAALSHLPRPAFLAAGLLVLGIQVALLTEHTDRWRQAERLQSALLADYRWADAPEVWVLGMPDSYDGIPLFRGFVPGEGLQDALRYVGGKPVRGSIREMASQVVQRPGDGLIVTFPDSLSANVSFRQWGNWFMREGKGATDHGGDDYAVHFAEGAYTLQFRDPDNSRRLLWADGGRWRIGNP